MKYKKLTDFIIENEDYLGADIIDEIHDILYLRIDIGDDALWVSPNNVFLIEDNKKKKMSYVGAYKYLEELIKYAKKYDSKIYKNKLWEKMKVIGQVITKPLQEGDKSELYQVVDIIKIRGKKCYVTNVSHDDKDEPIYILEDFVKKYINFKNL